MSGADLQDRLATWAGRATAQVASTVGGPRLSILIFHRVLREPDPIFPGEPDAARFERLMRIVAGTYRVLPLDEAVHRLARRELPSRALAITFDDGYADNHDVAMPILRRLGLTATVFVATDFLDGGRMWNDTAIECLRRTGADAVDLSEFGLERLPTSTPMQRRRAIERLLPVVKYKVPAEREPMLRRLHQLCGEPALPDDLMMSADQVRGLRRGGLGVGAHTVHHPILRTLSDAEASAEMGGSRERLQSLIDEPVTLFAYPNGQPGTDFDERHVAMAQRLGFSAALTTRRGVARGGDDPYALPRYTPWEPGALRWAARLAAQHARA